PFVSCLLREQIVPVSSAVVRRTPSRDRPCFTSHDAARLCFCDWPVSFSRPNTSRKSRAAQAARQNSLCTGSAKDHANVNSIISDPLPPPRLLQTCRAGQNRHRWSKSFLGLLFLL